MATQAAPDYVSEREEGRKALKELLKPVQGSLMIGRILAGLSGVLAIAPYIALVQLGGLFATAYATGQPVDADRAMLIVQILISTFCLRIFLLFIFFLCILSLQCVLTAQFFALQQIINFLIQPLSRHVIHIEDRKSVV